MSSIPHNRPSYYLAHHIQDFRVLETLSHSTNEFLISKLWEFSKLKGADKRYLSSQISAKTADISDLTKTHEVAMNILLEHRVICSEHANIKFNIPMNRYYCTTCYCYDPISPRHDQQNDSRDFSEPKSPPVLA